MWPLKKSTARRRDARTRAGISISLSASEGRRTSNVTRVPGPAAVGNSPSGEVSLPLTLLHPLISLLGKPAFVQLRKDPRGPCRARAIPALRFLAAGASTLPTHGKPEYPSAWLLLSQPPSCKSFRGNGQESPLALSQSWCLGWPGQRGSFWMCSKF